MNSTPFWHLTWKEYRANRPFWLAVVVFVAIGEAASAMLLHAPVAAIAIVTLALAGPAFFAVGSAAVAFAVEREEGTIDFLRFAPISPKLLVASKLAVAAAATVAMYGLLWPTVLMFTGGRLPDSIAIGSFLGLWLVAAFEAIAWGTFFSLLSDRPLLAICEGIFAVSLCANLLSQQTAEHTLASYAAAAPTRLAMAALVLVVDIFLGLRWLHRDRDRAIERRASAANWVAGWVAHWIAELRTPPWAQPRRPSARAATIARYVVWTIAGAFVGQLLGNLLLTLQAKVASLLWPDAPANIFNGISSYLPDALAVAGALVVISMLERSRRRTASQSIAVPRVSMLFILRYRVAMLVRLFWQQLRLSIFSMVALSAMWIGMVYALGLEFRWDWNGLADSLLYFIVVAGAAITGCWTFHLDQQRRYYRFFTEHNVPPRYVWLSRVFTWLAALLLSTTLILLIRNDTHQAEQLRGTSPLPTEQVMLVAIVSFAAGQWISMLVPSAVISGVVGIAIAAVLSLWTLLMFAMKVDVRWSVATIPLVLFFATWLRAPDWIGESRRWSARLRVAAAVLFPAAALLVAVPMHRAYEVPKVDPWANWYVKFPRVTNEARATAHLYIAAGDLLDSRGKLSEDRWLANNAKPLAMILEASEKRDCALGNPNASEELGSWRANKIVYLVDASARQLAREGKLDEALDRNFATLRVMSHLALVTWPAAVGPLNQIAVWSKLKGQTPGRIDGAIRRLAQLDPNLQHCDQILARMYFGLRRRTLSGDVVSYMDSAPQREADVLVTRFMPWERQRTLRMLDLLSSVAFARFQTVETELANPHGHVIDEIPPRDWDGPQGDGPYFVTSFPSYNDLLPGAARRAADWLSTTFPGDLAGFGGWGFTAVSSRAYFEVMRRVTIIRLAIEAYRLRHNGLPVALKEITSAALPAVPLDPYSGMPFRYFPHGVPSDNSHPTLGDRADAGIWSAGPNLYVLARGPGNEVGYIYRDQRVDRYVRDEPPWWDGLWFPLAIPAHKETDTNP